MKISIIVPCRNERQHIGEFLDSLLSQNFDLAWEVEVLVADGLSDDGTREILASYMEKAPSVRTIDNPGRIVSTGLNAAIASSTGEIVIRMDAHTIYARDYIRQCINVLQESGADNVGGPWIAHGHGWMGRAIAAAFQSPFCAGGGKAHNPDYSGEADTVYLGCWHRSAFERFGLFDASLVRNQDDEFNFRIRRAGGKIVQSSRIQSHYTPRSSLMAVFRQYLQYGFWKVAVIRKHGKMASWRHAVPALFVGSLLIFSLLLALATLFGWTSVFVLSAMVLFAELLVYSIACIAAAVPFMGLLELPSLLALPAVIAIHHISYGLGFLIGLLKPATPGSEQTPPGKFFTALTR